MDITYYTKAADNKIPEREVKKLVDLKNIVLQEGRMHDEDYIDDIVCDSFEPAGELGKAFQSYFSTDIFRNEMMKREFSNGDETETLFHTLIACRLKQLHFLIQSA